MSFATAIEEQKSERFIMVRLEPGRYVGSALASLGSGVYGMTFAATPVRIERNGVALSKVTTLSTNDQWAYDDTTQQITVKLASAPNVSTNVLILYYQLFYTSGRAQYGSSDPTADTGLNVTWQPRVDGLPRFEQSIRNIVSGVFTVGDGSLSIVNTDGDFDQYLTDQDSFNEKDIYIWLCVKTQGTRNAKLAYRGKIKSVSLSGKSVSLSFYDQFSLLSQPAYMGDASTEAYFIKQAGSFPSMDPNKSGQPCRYVAGYSNRCVTASLSGGDFTVINYVPPVGYRIVDGDEAVCTNYNGTLSKTNNRVWGLGRVKGGLASQTFGVYQASAPFTTDAVYNLTGVRLASHNYDVGETVEWIYSGTTYRAIVTRADTFSYAGDTFNLVSDWASGATPFIFGSTIVSKKKVAVCIVGRRLSDGSEYRAPLVQGRDFTVTETATSGGNTYVSITLANSFEDNHSLFLNADSTAWLPIDPNNYKVIYRIFPAASSRHGDVLKELVTKASLTADSATFTAQNTTLPVNCYMSIPYFDESDYSDYRRYCEDILASTLGYLSVGDSGVKYQLLAAPAAGQSVDRNTWSHNSLSTNIDYQDIVTEVIAYNPHNTHDYTIALTDSPSETRTSAKAQYLHGVKKSTRFRHVLEQIGTRIDAIMGLRAERRAVFRYDVPTQHLASYIGDDVTFSGYGNTVPGGASSANLKIFTIDKGVENVRVEASDLKGL
jgi:hypothetical protein